VVRGFTQSFKTAKLANKPGFKKRQKVNDKNEWIFNGFRKKLLIITSRDIYSGQYQPTDDVTSRKTGMP
jgi:hypothetical protein